MRKKFICALLSLVLAFSIMSPFDTAHALISPVIRVKISVAASSQINFSVCGSYRFENGETISAGDYTATINNGILISTRSGEPRYWSNYSSVLRLIQIDDNNPGDSYLLVPNSAHGGNYRYPGDLEIRVNGSRLDLINHIYIEHYLCGVVPHEMSNSWPIEALKVQAVAARSYAMNMMAKAKAGATYDVIDTSSNQVFKGYNKANDRAIEAVNQTRGQVLKCGSEYVEFYYAASNGGWTDIPQHCWTASAPLKPYHIIQYDPFDIANPSSLQEMIELPKTVDASNPVRYWDRSGGTMVAGDTARNDLASYFIRAYALPAYRANGYIANVTEDLEILGFSAVTPHTYDSRGGQNHHLPDALGNNPCPDFILATVTMTALAWRPGGVALGDVNGDGVINISDYTLVRLHILGLKPIPDYLQAAADVNGDGQINISDYTLIRLHILGLKPIEGATAEGLVREPATIAFDIDLTQLEPSGGYPVFKRNLRLITVEETGNAFYLLYRRYGHGVGMSQRGAQQRANSGHSYLDILYFYYPNTQIDTAY